MLTLAPWQVTFEDKLFYVTGDTTAKRGILVAYDVFGTLPA